MTDVEQSDRETLRYQTYVICRFDDGCFMQGELCDLHTAEAAIGQMTERQKATSVLMPVTVEMPREAALNFVANEFQNRLQKIQEIANSN